ncbi:ABC transporter permease [Microbacterium sp.]|uniref:ABC transporter permease n=1 Tax=Microbacterium sp. TaxID=51671 RepID=UPI003F959411
MRTAVWILVRVATTVATLTVLSVLVFWATEVLPGDAVGVVSGPNATDTERETVRLSLGLDRPAPERYLAWMAGILHGDFGVSLVSGREVGAILLARLGTSLAVTIPAAAGIVVLAGSLGILMGLRAGSRLDRGLTAATLGMIAIPEFLIATLLMAVLAVWIPLLPAVAIIPAGQNLWQHPELIVLPALALAIGGCGSTMRMLRASVAQTATTPFAEFARLNGIRGAAYVRLIGVNAAGPAIHSLTVMIAGLLGGAIVVETLFNVPGLGYEITRAVGNRDVPLVQGLSLVLSALVLVILLAGDICSRLLRQATTRQEQQ